MGSDWYTVEYDENSVAWLWQDKEPVLCLEHGMRLEVSGHLPPAYQTEKTPAPTGAPEAGEEG